MHTILSRIGEKEIECRIYVKRDKEKKERGIN